MLHFLAGAGLEFALISACETIDQACMQSCSLQTCEHLQASSSNTTSDAGTERIQRMFSFFSPAMLAGAWHIGFGL